MVMVMVVLDSDMDHKDVITHDAVINLIWPWKTRGSDKDDMVMVTYDSDMYMYKMDWVTHDKVIRIILICSHRTQSY